MDAFPCALMILRAVLRHTLIAALPWVHLVALPVALLTDLDATRATLYEIPIGGQARVATLSRLQLATAAVAGLVNRQALALTPLKKYKKQKRRQKVAASVFGTAFNQFLAALAVLHSTI